MEKMKTLLLTAAACTAIFASCNKDDDNNTVTPGANSSADMPLRMTAVTQDPESIFTWTSGYISATDIHFHAKQWNQNNNHGKGNGHGHGNGNNGGGEVHYRSTVNQRINLFDPGLIGNIAIPYGTYDNIKLKMSLEPANGWHALYLSGSYLNNGIVTPVQVIVDQPMELMAKWNDPVTINNVNVLSILSMNLSELTRGIDVNSLQNAQISNGTIVISGNSNQALYQLLLNNLQNMVKVKFQ